MPSDSERAIRVMSEIEIPREPYGNLLEASILARRYLIRGSRIVSYPDGKEVDPKSRKDSQPSMAAHVIGEDQKIFKVLDPVDVLSWLTRGEGDVGYMAFDAMLNMADKGDIKAALDDPRLKLRYTDENKPKIREAIKEHVERMGYQVIGPVFGKRTYLIYLFPEELAEKGIRKPEDGRIQKYGSEPKYTNIVRADLERRGVDVSSKVYFEPKRKIPWMLVEPRELDCAADVIQTAQELEKVNAASPVLLGANILTSEGFYVATQKRFKKRKSKLEEFGALVTEVAFPQIEKNGLYSGLPEWERRLSRMIGQWEKYADKLPEIFPTLDSDQVQ